MNPANSAPTYKNTTKAHHKTIKNRVILNYNDCYMRIARQSMEQNLLDVLETTRPFCYLDKKSIESLIAYGKLTEFSANQNIIEQGKQAQGLYILVNGTASVVIKVLVEGTIELANLKPGDFFGEVNLLVQTPCTASVISKSKVTCFILSKISFDLFNVYFPKIYYDIVRAIVEDVSTRERGLIGSIKKLIKKNPIKKIRLKKNNSNNLNKCVVLNNNEILQKYSYLPKLLIFSAFDTSELNQLIHACKLIEVSTNTKLIQPRKSHMSSFFILRGAVKITIDQVTIGVLGPNTLFCPSTVINVPQEITYTTCSNSVLLEITEEQLIQMKKKFESMWYKLYGILCLYIVSLQRKLVTQMIRLSSEKRDVFISNN